MAVPELFITWVSVLGDLVLRVATAKLRMAQAQHYWSLLNKAIYLSEIRVLEY